MINMNKNIISAIIVILVLAGNAFAITGNYGNGIDTISYVQIGSGANYSGYNVTNIELINGVNYSDTVMYQPNSYFIWIKDGLYYGRDGNNGTIVHSTNTSYIFEKASLTLNSSQGSVIYLRGYWVILNRNYGLSEVVGKFG